MDSLLDSTHRMHKVGQWFTGPSCHRAPGFLPCPGDILHMSLYPPSARPATPCIQKGFILTHLTPNTAAVSFCRMESPEPSFYYPPEKSWLDKLQAIIEVLILSGLVSGFLASIPFSLGNHGPRSLLMMDGKLVAASLLLEAGIALCLLWLLLRAHRESVRDIGLHGEGWLGDLWLGIAIVPLFFAVNVLVMHIFRVFIPQYYLDTNPLTEIIRTPADLVMFLLSALIAGGIKEELQRAFIIVRFRQHLGGAKVGLVIWSAAFGAQHYVQGAQGMVAATLFGFIFGILFLARRSVLPAIFAHAIYDTAALLGYWFTRNLH